MPLGCQRKRNHNMGRVRLDCSAVKRVISMEIEREVRSEGVILYLIGPIHVDHLKSVLQSVIGLNSS